MGALEVDTEIFHLDEKGNLVIYNTTDTDVEVPPPKTYGFDHLFRLAAHEAPVVDIPTGFGQLPHTLCHITTTAEKMLSVCTNNSMFQSLNV